MDMWGEFTEGLLADRPGTAVAVVDDEDGLGVGAGRCWRAWLWSGRQWWEFVFELQRPVRRGKRRSSGRAVRASGGTGAARWARRWGKAARAGGDAGRGRQRCAGRRVYDERRTGKAEETTWARWHEGLWTEKWQASLLAPICFIRSHKSRKPTPPRPSFHVIDARESPNRNGRDLCGGWLVYAPYQRRSSGPTEGGATLGIVSQMN